ELVTRQHPPFRKGKRCCKRVMPPATSWRRHEPFDTRRKLGLNDIHRSHAPEGGVFENWGKHIRYFLARYPEVKRDAIAKRLVVYGIRSLLSSHRLDDLTLDTLDSITGAAEGEVMTVIRDHARSKRGISLATKGKKLEPPPRPQANTQQDSKKTAFKGDTNANPVNNVKVRTIVTAPAVTARPDVLTRYPFVDGLEEGSGGGVGGALQHAVPAIPLHHLAKREIK
ncbi:unnamed protein product, partial [Choristocarpus tenellus]